MFQADAFAKRLRHPKEAEAKAKENELTVEKVKEAKEAKKAKEAMTYRCPLSGGRGLEEAKELRSKSLIT